VENPSQTGMAAVGGIKAEDESETAKNPKTGEQ
jgi:hypothetical protein